MTEERNQKKPNVVLVFGDQWRAQATGYAGDPNVKTPELDALEKQSLNFTQAIAGCPVCSPTRASLMTGQRPLTHGVFLNDVRLGNKAVSLAQAFTGAGYDSAYIGKWHLDGPARSGTIPPERRQGFDYWKVLNCTHDYINSAYYSGDSDELLRWEGYDAIAQTEDAQDYIRNHDGSKPFLLVLSWGPPHNPYRTAPPEFMAMYENAEIELRPNVPIESEDQARQSLKGYYAHCSALDACVGKLLETLREKGIEEDTIFVFTSDHGDMLGSQGHIRKQRPWDESIRVPFLLRYPSLLGKNGRRLKGLIDSKDIMPTLLGLCEIPVPPTVEGLDFSGTIKGGSDPGDGSALIQCVHPFGEYLRKNGAAEYRGLRTHKHTYVRRLDGPWLLYDNEADPYQLENLVGKPEHSAIQEELDERLRGMLKEARDEFLPGIEYIKRWGYTVDESGTVPYTL